VKRTTLVAIGMFSVGLLALARPLSAQVGYDPARSPYQDVPWRQGLTFTAGWYNAAIDPAGVAPRSAPMYGLRYDLQLAGPAQLTVRSMATTSKRHLLDPRQPKATRLLGEVDAPLLLTDLGLTINLTGQRSWHGLVPLVQFGAGVASDLKPASDVGNYKFGGTSGTTFALSLGTGVRYVPGGRFNRWEVRGDVTDYLFAIKYPGSYISTITTPSVLKSNASSSSWRHNAGLTLGLTYRFLR
jgi:hypothetical protein